MMALAPLPADIFLAPMAGLCGKGIALGQWLNGDGFRKVQHVGIYLGDGQTIEAMPGGAIIGELDLFDPRSLVWSTGLLDLTQNERSVICDYGRGLEGVPYSWLDYDALAMHRFHIPTPGLRRYIETSGHMICSQLVDRVYKLAGIQLFSDGRWDGDVTPADLYNLFETIRSNKMALGV